jgi:hypothetical protein
MDYQTKQKQVKQGSTDQEIFKAITEFHTSGISTEDFCGVYGIDESTFKSWNRKYNKMYNADKIGLIEVTAPEWALREPQVLFEVETFDGNVFRFYRESNPEFIKQLIG